MLKMTVLHGAGLQYVPSSYLSLSTDTGGMVGSLDSTTSCKANVLVVKRGARSEHTIQ